MSKHSLKDVNQNWIRSQFISVWVVLDMLLFAELDQLSAILNQAQSKVK